jgi:hypothetical protein
MVLYLKGRFLPSETAGVSEQLMFNKKLIEAGNVVEEGRIDGRLAGFDACFFCLGISSAGMKEANYERLTYGITLAAAETLSRLTPEMAFTYLSGVGTDSSARPGHVGAG